MLEPQQQVIVHIIKEEAISFCLIYFWIAILWCESIKPSLYFEDSSMKNYIQVAGYSRETGYQNKTNIYGLNYSKQASISRWSPWYGCNSWFFTRWHAFYHRSWQSAWCGAVDSRLGRSFRHSRACATYRIYYQPTHKHDRFW